MINEIDRQTQFPHEHQNQGQVVNIAKKPDPKKTTDKSRKNTTGHEDRESLGLLHELSGLSKTKKKGIIRIEVDSRRR